MEWSSEAIPSEFAAGVVATGNSMTSWFEGLGGPEFATAVVWTFAALILLVIVLVIIRLIRGLTDGGLDVIDIGIVPTPVLYFSLFHLNADGGVMITGSHNAAEYNGFKLCLGKEALHGEDIQQL